MKFASCFWGVLLLCASAAGQSKPAAAPISALAYRPDGKLLVVGGRNEAILLQPSTGEVQGKLPGQSGRITAAAFSRDGQHFAIASGTTGASGEVRQHSVPSGGVPGPEAMRTLKAHQDVVYDLVFSPDSKLLATAGYDRLIKLWDAGSGKLVRTLKDHSDTIYGLAFSPDGKLLASAAADRAVKVWEVATGRRLYTLSDSTDWLYAVAWSPDGRYLAAAGVDRSIRVWEVSSDGGKLTHSVFAHEGPVLRLFYANDGTTLYSLSEDRTVKAWEAGRMAEKKVYPRQSDTVLSLAVSPDHTQLALGRYDGKLILLDEATGKVQFEQLPVKPEPPQVTKLTPAAVRRGQTVRVTLEGKHLEGVTAVATNHAGIVAKLVDARTPGRIVAELTLAANLPAGAYPLTAKNEAGQSGSQNLILDLFESETEKEPNESPTSSPSVAIPRCIVGSIGRAGDVDYVQLTAEPGQEIGVQAVAGAVGSKLDPVLVLTDATGKVVAQSAGGVLGYTSTKGGTYALGIRDRDYRGGSDMTYRMQIGGIPVVTSVHPLGLQRGTEAEIRLNGVNLGETKSVRIKAATDAALGSRIPVTVPTPSGPALGNPSVVVGEFPEVAVSDNSMLLPVPGTANGRLDGSTTMNTWRFAARKGTSLILEVNARRIGSPLDSVLEILDSNGRLLDRATLRCQAMTYSTFRDHDSASPGIRIEAWNELAINDYLYVAGELVRIDALPKNPDDDCRFCSVGNQRVGYLGTTPRHHSMGTPMYKVAIHPAGSTFPPNGFPIFTVPYRNDDGGPRYGKDSVLLFDPPAGGEYQARIGDARGQMGPDCGYRLTVRPPRPSFTVTFNPTSPAVWRGGAIPVNVTAERVDFFEGAIDLRLENLPPGFHAPATKIPVGDNTTAFALYADADAVFPDKVPPLKLVASATIAGAKLMRETTGGLPKLVEPGDLVTTTEQAEVSLRPGGEVKLTVAIERRNGFKGRVPIDVRGLPHGVRVLDIGLNGILITEKETTRTFVIYAEPWVEPTEHPFVVLARREGKNTEHAARSVLLKVK